MLPLDVQGCASADRHHAGVDHVAEAAVTAAAATGAVARLSDESVADVIVSQNLLRAATWKTLKQRGIGASAGAALVRAAVAVAASRVGAVADASGGVGTD